MDADLKTALISIVGENNVIDDAALFGPFTDDFTDHYKSEPLAVVRPANTAEVSAVVKLCASRKVPIVTQGGNTNLTGSASTFRPGQEIILSLTRMKRVLEADPIGATMTVEAGMTLSQVHEAAAEVCCFFPLSFAAEGNATIGGCAACNAGGVAVLRYGTTRELVLGLEVVLPDGRVWNGLKSLRKDNTGYDLRDLFIGSEGTLGVITKLVLKLFAQPNDKETAFIAVGSPHRAAQLLTLAKSRLDSTLTAFELISNGPVSRVRQHLPDIEVPGIVESDWYVLLELSHAEKPEESLLELLLEEAFEAGLIEDAALASSVADSEAMWHVRESIPLADRTAGGSIHSDISLPISRIPEFLEQTSAELKAAYPWLTESVYGHLGDGNLHYNFVSPEDPELTYRHEAGIREILYRKTHEFAGSISAEHGIGMLKLEHNLATKSELEIELMQKIKTAFDPEGIMNPGKLL